MPRSFIPEVRLRRRSDHRRTPGSSANERNPSAGERASTARVADILAPSNVKKPQDLDAKDLPRTRLSGPRTAADYAVLRLAAHGRRLSTATSPRSIAFADGVVETAGWNSGGYGLQIVVDHGNGIAHATPTPRSCS